MAHLIRGGGLLAAVFATLLLLKGQFTPPSFGVYGFYRTDSVQEWANRPMTFAAPASCQYCHQDKNTTLSQASHKTVPCQTCHGPGQSHIVQGTKPVVDTSRAFCALCHEKLISRPSTQPQVDLADHGGQATCVSCHNPHAPRLAGPPKIPHTLEGRSDCLMCHGPGGLKPFPSNHAGRTKDICRSCHQTVQTSGAGQAKNEGSAQSPGPSATLTGSSESGALTVTAQGLQTGQNTQNR